MKLASISQLKNLLFPQTPYILHIYNLSSSVEVQVLSQRFVFQLTTRGTDRSP